jgi:hypothetical protein
MVPLVKAVNVETEVNVFVVVNCTAFRVELVVLVVVVEVTLLKSTDDLCVEVFVAVMNVLVFVEKIKVVL